LPAKWGSRDGLAREHTLQSRFISLDNPTGENFTRLA
jgi:hypothetical protein